MGISAKKPPLSLQYSFASAQLPSPADPKRKQCPRPFWSHPFGHTRLRGRGSLKQDLANKRKRMPIFILVASWVIASIVTSDAIKFEPYRMCPSAFDTTFCQFFDFILQISHYKTFEIRYVYQVSVHSHLKVWELVFLGSVKSHSHKLALKWGMKKIISTNTMP